MADPVKVRLPSGEIVMAPWKPAHTSGVATLFADGYWPQLDGYVIRTPANWEDVWEAVPVTENHDG